MRDAGRAKNNVTTKTVLSPNPMIYRFGKLSQIKSMCVQERERERERGLMLDNASGLSRSFIVVSTTPNERAWHNFKSSTILRKLLLYDLVE